MHPKQEMQLIAGIKNSVITDWYHLVGRGAAVPFVDVILENMTKVIFLKTRDNVERFNVEAVFQS